jgi:tetratricopeptide (TPR) repeat protein
MDKDLLNNIINFFWPNNTLGSLYVSGVTVIFWVVNKIGLRVQSGRLLRILKRFTAEEIKNHSENYIRPKARSENINGGKSFDVLKKFSKNIFRVHDTNKHFLVLADSGMGKTSLLINLVKDSTRFWQLRKRYQVAMIPVRSISSEDDILKITAKRVPEETILLLDALDEDNVARQDLDMRLRQLYKWTIDFRKIVFTSRTQFFPADKYVPKQTTERTYTGGGKFFEFTHIHLEPFSKGQVRKFLKRKYQIIHPKNIFKREVAKKLVFDFYDVSSRPLLLSYINDLLPADKNVFKITLQLWGTSLLQTKLLSKWSESDKIRKFLEDKIDQLYSQSVYSTKTKIYRTIVRKWIERESQEINEEAKAKHEKSLFSLAVCTAYLIYQESKEHNKLSVSREKVYNYAFENGIEIDEIHISGRSLLFRNAEGEFIFGHQSILEYFMAIFATKSVQVVSELYHKPGWENFHYFLQEMMVKNNIYPFLKSCHKDRIEFQFGKNDIYHNVDDFSMGLLEHITSLRITGDIGYVDSNLFFALHNLTNEAYYNILEYLVYQQHYSFKEIHGYLGMVIRNDDENHTVLEKVINIYEYLRVYDIAAHYLKLYIDSKDIGFPYPEWKRLIEFYRLDGDKENFMPLRRRYFEELTARTYRFYYYLDDLLKSEYYEDVIDVYEQFHDQFPFDSDAVEIAAIAYYRLDNVENALTLYRYILTEKPDHFFAIKGVYECLDEKNESEKGFAFLTEMFFNIEKNELKVDVLFFHAKKLFEKIGFDEAKSLIWKLSEHCVKDVDYLNELLVFYKEVNAPEIGIAEALQAMKIYPNHFQLPNQAGNLCAKIDDNENAIEFYLQSIKIIENHPNENEKNLYYIVSHNLATIYEASGDLENAIVYYKKAFEDPKNNSVERYGRDLADACEKNGEYEKSFCMYRMLFARFHKVCDLESAAQVSLKSKIGKHIHKMYIVLGGYKPFEYEELKTAYQSIEKFLVDYDILEPKGNELIYAKRLFSEFYYGVAEQYLEEKEEELIS